jgi:hypothetical protein
MPKSYDIEEDEEDVIVHRAIPPAPAGRRRAELVREGVSVLKKEEIGFRVTTTDPSREPVR